MYEYPKLRREILDTCLWLRREGLVLGMWGNVSARTPDGNLLLTPSRVPYDAMRTEDMVVLAPDGTQLCGEYRSTSEREVHRKILNRRRDVGAVIHTHSPFAMAACALEGGIPPLTEEICQWIGGEIPLTARFVPSEDHVALGDAAADAIGERMAVLIRNHGAVCCGADLAAARLCCQVVEKAAQIHLLTAGLPGVSPVREPYITAARTYFRDAYGRT